MKLRHFAQDCENAFGAFSIMRLAHFRPCVWRILGRFGTFSIMRLAHFGQAQWHSLDLRGYAALGITLCFYSF